MSAPNAAVDDGAHVGGWNGWLAGPLFLGHHIGGRERSAGRGATAKRKEAEASILEACSQELAAFAAYS
jgi:hypothetical protein